MDINITIPVKNVLSFPATKLDRYSGKLLPPNNIGAYVLRDENNNTLYVGMSTNLVERLKHHILGKESSDFSDKISLINVYITENNAYADMLETYLIISENPIYNKAKVPQEPNNLTELETELFDIDEKIELWKEQIDELYSEIDEGYHAFLDDTSCIYADIKRLKAKINEAEKRRKYLMTKGAKPLENFSQLAHEESRQRSNNFYRRVFVYSAKNK